MSFREIVSAKAQLKGVEIEELARIGEVSIKTMERYLAGTKVPFRVAMRLAEHLGASPWAMAGFVTTEPDVTGLTWSAWHTCWDGVWRTEVQQIALRQSGSWVYAQGDADPDQAGSYPWRGDLRLSRGLLQGAYEPTDPGILSQGIIQINIAPSNRYGTGIWCGPSHDGICEMGAGVMADSRAAAVHYLEAIRGTHPQTVLRELPPPLPVDDERELLEEET